MNELPPENQKRRPRVVVVGSANMDLVARADRLPRPGETVLAHAFDHHRGGKGANQAVAAARSGAATVFVGNVGDDAFGIALVNGLAREGIAVHLMHRLFDVPTGVALITVDADGQNIITVAPGANLRTGPASVREAIGLLSPETVVVMQLEIPLDTVAAVAGAARQSGARVVLNPAPVRALPDDLLRNVDVLVPNEQELYALAGADRSQAPADVGRELLGRTGVGAVVVSLGERGAIIVTVGGNRFISAPRVTPIDTTGAGDVLVGAMAARWARRDSLEDAVRYGCTAAALSVQRPGAQDSAPFARDVEALL